MLFPVSIEVKSSRRLRAALLLAHLLAFLSLATLQPGPLALSVAAGVSLGSFGWLRWREVPLQLLQLHRDGMLTWQLPGRERVPAEVLPGTTVLGWLLVLRLRLEERGRPRTLVIVGDSLPPAGFRQLRLWLRWISRDAA